MKAKIIDNMSEDYGVEFKVRRMNYDQIIVNYPTGTGLKKFLIEQVELVRENEIDDFLIEHRVFLKIKLKRGISVTFYNSLYEALKLEIEEEVNKLNVLRDKYNVNKRGAWSKEILLTVNDKFPLEITASGLNFKRNDFNISINVVDKNDFIGICNEEISNIEKEIDIKRDMISGFIDAKNNIKKVDQI